MASKGNPRLTIRVPSENLAEYQRVADLHKMEVTDWARGILDYAAGVGNAPADPSWKAEPPHPTRTRLVRPTQIEQELADRERESPFKQ